MVHLGAFERADRFALKTNQPNVTEGAFDDLVVDPTGFAQEGLLDFQLLHFVDVVMVDRCRAFGAEKWVLFAASWASYRFGRIHESVAFAAIVGWQFTYAPLARFDHAGHRTLVVIHGTQSNGLSRRAYLSFFLFSSSVELLNPPHAQK